ncbi:MAG: hypothetical protein HN413_05590 [Chloroflexi bacterium]|jgi:hypothetical protein|nr:hypothetical protein [Chloroflexota bacterium]
MNTILAVAHDPGGAAALKPVLLALGKRSDTILVTLVRNRVSFFDGVGISIENYKPGELSFAQLCEWAFAQLNKYAPDLLLTATSGKASVERAFIRTAHQRGIPCLTVLDSWTNYIQRFLEPGETRLSLSVLPDTIAVIDDFAAQEMYALGFPQEILCITGQPALDELFRWGHSPEARQSQILIRRRYGLFPEIPLIVFISQPIEAMYPPNTPAYRGYTEVDVLKDIMKAVSALSPRPFLLVKPHPKENHTKFMPLFEGNASSAIVSTESSTEALVQAAELVIGMTSIVLVQGLLLGRKVLSYQPDLVGQDALVTSRMGLSKTLRDRPGLQETLRSMLAGDDASLPVLPEIWQSGRAVDRICDLVDLNLSE